MGTSADYAKWIVANADKKGTPDFDTVAKAYQAARATESAAPATPAQQPTPGEDKGWLSNAANAVATGINRGAVALAGLPMDMVQNVGDLGRAALGSGYIAATGKEPPEALQLKDRKNVIGTSDYLLNKIGGTSLGSSAINAENPEYQGGYLQNGGSALAGAALTPYKSIPQAAQALLTTQASAAGSKAAFDATGSPIAAIAAGLLPAGAVNLGVSGLKAAVRGGEQGRQDMAQRVQDLKNAGVTNPTVGLASGNSLVGGVENILANTPGAMTVMKNSRTKAVGQLQATTNDAADAAAPASLRGSQATGMAINKGIKTFANAFKDSQEGLYNELDKTIPKDAPTKVGQTGAALEQLTSTIPGADETSKAFVNGRISAIKKGFDVDTGAVISGPTESRQVESFGRAPTRVNSQGLTVPTGPVVGTSTGAIRPKANQTAAPAGMNAILSVGKTAAPPIDTQQVSTPILGAAPTRTNAIGLTVPQGPSLGTQTVAVPPRKGGWLAGLGVENNDPATLPFEAVKKLRTSVGSELTNNTLTPDVPNRQWKQLYGALSGDIQGAAAEAGPEATAAYNRANNYTRSGLGRLEAVQGFTSDPTNPERSMAAVQSTLGDNASMFNTLKKSLPEGARGQIAGSVIDKLGQATPGQQNESGDVWSPDRFLTNWNRMSPEARSGLLSGFPNSDQVARDVNAVAKATSMMRDNSKLWANPSGTAAAGAARAILTTPAFAVATGHPLVAAGGAGLLGAANLAARGLTSQKAVNALLQQTQMTPEELSATLASMAARGQGSQKYAGQ